MGLAEVIEAELARVGGPEEFAKQQDERFGYPKGASSKLFAMSEDYDRKLHMYMLIHPDASKNDLRFKILPPLVEGIFKDWSARKQEFLVWAGVQVWFDERRTSKNPEHQYIAWVGFHEYCTKQVNKQCFPSGKGDRELFGWTNGQGDYYADPHSRVHWSDDEEDGEAVDDETADDIGEASDDGAMDESDKMDSK